MITENLIKNKPTPCPNCKKVEATEEQVTKITIGTKTGGLVQ